MLVTASFFDINVNELQKRRDQALVSSAKRLITALEAASQRADALSYELQDYVDRIESDNKPAPKRKAKAKK